MRTPKTLQEAIQNGITDGVSRAVKSVGSPPLARDVIAEHVIDFLAQKFRAHELNYSGQETEALWEAITGREYGGKDGPR